LGIDEAGLTRALAAGDVEAFGVFVEQETPRVYRICYRILGRVDEAEEATQEAFVQAFRALDRYRGDGPPGAWVARIATRESWRRASLGARRRAQTTSLEGTGIDAPQDAASPLDEAIHGEERERVRLSVAQLDEPYREVMVLRYYGELSVREISAVLRRPEGTIKAQLHRGLKRLRHLLEGSPT
jgi:RNA polymerase sigma-70 factor (ECF subfamily)